LAAGLSETAPRMKTLVLGLGNPLVADDSVGLRVVARLKPLLADRPDVEVGEDYWGGLRLMERMVGYDRVIVVDAICTGQPPGTILRLAPGGLPTNKSNSTHDITLPMALALGRRAEATLPSDEYIRLIGIEAEDVLTISEQCTPAVAAAIPRAVDAVLEELKELSGSGATP
jgi:hydrogenase maturation protease